MLVVLHEYGHFLVAKKNGVEVEEFGLGFPPRLWGKKMGRGIFRSYYSLNLLPLGGFVRLKGEHDEARGAGTYGGSSLYVKAKIILAGVCVNFLIAIVLFTILAWMGMPRLLPSNQFSDQQFSLPVDTHILEEKVLIAGVIEDSPAAGFGFEAGDQILSVEAVGQPLIEVEAASQLKQITQKLAGQEILLAVQRDDQTFEHRIQLQGEAAAAETGHLGIVPFDYVIQRNTWSAPLTGVVLTGQFTKVTLQGLGQVVASLFKGDTESAKASITGPIGIFFILKTSASQGLAFVLMIIALLSLTLAIMNSLPIPALDGGRLFLTLLFHKILRRPLTKEIEGRAISYSMAALITLIVLITWVDIRRFF